MSEWKEVQLSEVYDFSSGLSKPRDQFGFGYPFVSFKDVFDNTFLPIHLKQLVNSTNKERQSCSVMEGDVFLTRTSETQEELGISSVALRDYPEATFNGFTKRLRPKQKHTIVPAYAAYYFRSPKFRTTITSISSLTTRASLNNEMLSSLKITIPPINIQQSIAEVLSSLDDKIDLLHKQNQTLEQLAETMFRQWFVEEAEDCWEEKTFGDFIKPKKGKNITKSEAVEGVYPVVAGGLEPSCYHNEANTKTPVVTISASGANAGFVRLYQTQVWSSDSSYIDETVTPYVYFAYIFLRIHQTQLTDKQEGSAQPHIYPRHIMDLNMLDYPEKLIKTFEEKVKPFFLKMKSNNEQILNLEILRDSLLPKLMSGAVRVNN